MIALTAITISAVGIGSAAAKAPSSPSSTSTTTDVIFLGDSVTAGFGHCGAEENAPDVTCTVNQDFANAWYDGDNSLDDCDPPTIPDDRCSNNNFDGAPWNAGPWTNSPNSPTTAYSFQIAQSQPVSSAATIENWAMTGSTPANWDTNGAFNSQLTSISNKMVVLTLGTNPLMSNFLDIDLDGYPASTGACSNSTTEQIGSGVLAYSVADVASCAQRLWAQNNQTQHLTNIYNTLLRNGNKVLVLGYYHVCPWSFGNWQPDGSLEGGPASGQPCTSQFAVPQSGGGPEISQYQQATGTIDAVNSWVAAAVASVQHTNPRGANLQFTLPNQAQWDQHQAWSSSSWIFLNDTWLHPSFAGHTQLAATVTSGACVDFRQWCGSQPRWNATSAASKPVQVPAPNAKQQSIQGKPPAKLQVGQPMHLPSYTKQDQVLYWRAVKRTGCTVKVDQVVPRKRGSSCELIARAKESASLKPLHKHVTIDVRHR